MSLFLVLLLLSVRFESDAGFFLLLDLEAFLLVLCSLVSTWSFDFFDFKPLAFLLPLALAERFFLEFDSVGPAIFPLIVCKINGSEV